jgi:hypothetical protein
MCRQYAGGGFADAAAGAGDDDNFILDSRHVFLLDVVRSRAVGAGRAYQCSGREPARDSRFVATSCLILQMCSSAPPRPIEK